MAPADDATDRAWMRRALVEAARGEGAVEPNPMVGAVVVRDGKAVGVGHHERFGGPHAEVHALAQAGELARGATLYVTLEPCCHHGKTPPCVDAVLAAGIARVVAAHRDPFPKVAGGGLARLRASGVAVTVEVEGDAARALNAPYLKRVIRGTPFVTAKWAMTLDGRTATATGDSRWISNPRSRALVHEVRGRMDAILVGVGTARADDPELTARPPGPKTPARVVLDSTGRLPLDGKLARTARAVPVWVATTDRAPGDKLDALRDLGSEILRFAADPAGRVPVPALLAELGRRGVTNLLVEGGGGVLGSFLDAGEVDAVDVFIAPKVEGGTHAHTPAHGRGLVLMADAWQLEGPEIAVVDGDVRIRGRLARGPWALALAAAVAGAGAGSTLDDPKTGPV